MATIHKVDIAGQAGGWFDETSTASGWFYRELEDQAGPPDETPGNACMSLDVCVEGYAQTVEYYATDEIQGTQCAPLDDAPPEATIVNTSFPDYVVDELFEPGEFWFQTGPPTSADDETGQTRGGTLVPDYLEPDDQIDPSDADWQNPTTLNDAACTFPMLQGNARSTTAAGTTHTATLPEYAAGYGVLILIATSAVETLTFPDGWQVVFNRSTTALTTNLNVAAIWRVMDGTEGSTVDITSVANETLTFQAFSFTQFDPYTGPDFAVDITTGANDDPPSLTHDWPSQKAMWLAVDFGPDNTHTVANAAVPYRTWGMFGYASGSASQYVLVGLRQIEAATENPGAFTGGSITSSATATIAIRGICYDDLNDDPAGCSVPSELEPEAELLQDGWQSGFAALDDPLQVFDDPRTGVAYQPDWLEPDAEPNPDDVTFGWQRQSLVEEDYQPGEAWTAVTEPQEDVFDYSTDWWIQTPTFTDDPLDVDDETTISTCWPEWLEPEAEPLQDGWQLPLTIDVEQCQYPYVQEYGQGGPSNDLISTLTVPMPSSTVVGDMLVAFIGGDNSGTITPPAGWSTVIQNTSTPHLSIFYKIADGTEGADEDFTFLVTSSPAYTIFRVVGADPGYAPEISARTTLDNPLSLSPSWGSDLTLYVAYTAFTNVTEGDFFSWPDNMGSTRGFYFNVTSGLDSGHAFATHQAAAASFDPTDYGIAGGPNLSTFTLAIKGNCFADPPVSVSTPDYINDTVGAEVEADSDGWQHNASDDGPICTFPSVVSVTSGNDLTTGTSHVISLPTVSVGDLAVVVFATNGNTHTATAGWTEDVDNESVVVYSRVIDGSEGGSMTITSSASSESVWYVYRVAAGSFDPLTPIAAATSLNSATQDPPNLAFGWTDKTLVLAAIAGDTAASPITFTSGPSNLTTGFVGQETGGTALPDCYLAVAWGFVDGSSLNPNAFNFTAQASNYDIATIAIRGACPLDLTTPGGHEFPADLEPEAEVDTNGWTSEPLHDLPTDPEIVGRSVPDDMEPEAEPDTNGWFSAPLHDTPSTDDITDTSVPSDITPDENEAGYVDAGWQSEPLHDTPVVVEPPDTGTSTGTLPGHVARKRWWIEKSSKEETSRRRRFGTTWPDLPEPKGAPPFNPKVITSKTTRPRLDQISRDWKLKMRRARAADDLIIATIIAALLAEKNDDNDD